MYLDDLFELLRKIFRKLSDILGIQWAPIDIPTERRLQTLGAAWWIFLIIFGEGVSIMLAIRLLYSDYWYLALIYAIWMLNDIDTCNKGGRRSEWVRNWSCWRYYRDYFPQKLVKTVDLDPSKNYLFACFPHGLVSSGAFGAFATNALNFHKLFPGMTCHVITLGGHFLVPFFRDLIMALGTCGSSQESLLHLLSLRKHRGKCVALIVGGAAEALDSHPGEYKLMLSKRKGFVRVAMMAGSPLVPVFVFGEPDVFRPMQNPQDSFLRRFQEWFKKHTGISPIFPLGRGMFQYTFGVLPLRTPITTVVGHPLAVEKNLEPTDEQVNEVHAEFTRILYALFESEKAKYLKDHENVKLILA